MAYAIGRKVGNAVQRNLLRRRMRAIVAEQAAGMPTGAYLVRIGPDRAGARFQRIEGGHEPSNAEGDEQGPAGADDRRAPRGRPPDADGPDCAEAPQAAGVGTARPAGRRRWSACPRLPAGPLGPPDGLPFRPVVLGVRPRGHRRPRPGGGTALAVRRIARCTPWGSHGIDPVPDRRAP